MHQWGDFIRMNGQVKSQEMLPRCQSGDQWPSTMKWWEVSLLGGLSIPTRYSSAILLLSHIGSHIILQHNHVTHNHSTNTVFILGVYTLRIQKVRGIVLLRRALSLSPCMGDHVTPGYLTQSPAWRLSCVQWMLGWSTFLVFHTTTLWGGRAGQRLYIPLYIRKSGLNVTWLPQSLIASKETSPFWVDEGEDKGPR